MEQTIKPTEARILSEDALKHIYECEQNHRRPTLQSIAGALQISLDDAAGLIGNMTDHHLLHVEEGNLFLTPAGRDYALQIIRAHRLWERYLADETGFSQEEWHNRADRREHTLSPAEADELSARLGHPTHDPHGDPIPTAEGEVVSHGGQPLTTANAGDVVRIVHIEDEPAVVYAQLVAEGLSPGMVVRLLENNSRRLRFTIDGEKYTLAPVIAANVSVVPVPPEEVAELGPTRRLTSLKPGQTGRVASISPACRGPERRRLMDLGILPGTQIKAELQSPGGDPTAYLIRGALIALRTEQANLINILPAEETA